MLKNKYRLTRDQDIQQVFKRGKTYFGPFFNIKILKNNFQNPRFCIVISSNISKNAVIRNRLKRRFKSIIFKNLSDISQNCDFVILTKPSVLNLNFKDLNNNFLNLIRKF